MVLAAAVLFYVSYWLLSKIEAARWMAFLRDRVGKAQSRWALFGVAFLAVYREGVETILFYQALAGAGRGFPIVMGFVTATVVLAAVAIAVLRFGVRLPMRPLFAVTGALLYYLAVVFAGQGVRELQEAGWVGLTPVPGFSEIGWLGLYPSAETLAAQAVLVGLAILAWVVITRRVRLGRAAVPRPSEAA
jgi:high-affinity iron transporter